MGMAKTRNLAASRWLGAAALVALAGCTALGPSGPAPGAPPADPPPRLAGSSWYWLGTVGPAGSAIPADPAVYNLEFLDGGQLAAEIDCHRAGATWRQSAGNALSIGPLSGGKVACPAPSEAERLARQLPTARSARVADGLLAIETGDAGTMLFARDPDWKLRVFECPGGPPVVAVFGREQAVVRFGGRQWAMQQQRAASGVRYGAGNAILFNRGKEVTLVNEGKQIAGPCVSRR
jgi:hypothetical protein